MKLKNILTLTISFILSVGLVFGSFAVFNPIKLEKERQATLAIAKEYFNTATDFESFNGLTVGSVKVSLALKVKGSGNSDLGYVYEANVTNTYGNIRVRVVAGIDQKISVVDLLELNQTQFENQTKNLARSYQFMSISSIADGYGGATSVSIRSLIDMMRAIRDVHESIPQFVVPEPYKKYFGEYTIDSTNTQSVGSATVVIETVTGATTSGTVYTITKVGQGWVEHSDSAITMIVVLDTEGNIIGVELPFELYGHSKDEYYDQVKAYAETFIGDHIEDIADAYTGGTNTGESDTPHNSMSLVHSEIAIVKGLWLA